MRFLAFGGCAVLCFGITPAGPAPEGDCGRGVSSDTGLFSTGSHAICVLPALHDCRYL